jgi:hypothetical protein
MNCPRCNGLAVSDYSIDQQAGPSSGFHGWRCVNCGMISDDVIHENQLTALTLKKSQRHSFPRSPDPVQMQSLRRCVPRSG